VIVSSRYLLCLVIQYGWGAQHRESFSHFKPSLAVSFSAFLGMYWAANAGLPKD
jgi:hypothetical protein